MNTAADTAKVKDWINQVYAQVCVETEGTISTSTMDLTPGSSSYTFPSQVLRIKEMYVTTVSGVQSGPIIQTTLDQILNLRRSSGGPTVANGSVTHYAFLGINDFEVYPTPSAADTLTMWSVSLPDPLFDDVDVPVLQEPYASKLLEYGALAEAADFKGDPSEPEYRQLFETWKQRYKSHLTRKAGGQPGHFRVFSEVTYPPHDRSVYP